jgi:hypothetical protein
MGKLVSASGSDILHADFPSTQDCIPTSSKTESSEILEVWRRQYYEAELVELNPSGGQLDFCHEFYAVQKNDCIQEKGYRILMKC